MYAARTAADLARERLKAWRNNRRALAGCAAAIGMAGAVGLLALVATDLTETHDRAILILLCTLMTCFPLLACVGYIIEDKDEEGRIIAALESALSVAAQAERLAEIEGLADVASPSMTSRFALNIVLDDVEQAAAAAKGRERRLRGQVVERNRRHARITPRNRRVVITTEDGRRLSGMIIDVSVSGIAVEGNLPRIGVGDRVFVGSRGSKAIRLLPRGLAFEFDDPIPAGLLDVDIVV